MTENCFSLKEHLEQFAWERHLRQFLNDDQGRSLLDGPKNPHTLRPLAQVIEMILALRLGSQSKDQPRSKLRKTMHLREVFHVGESLVTPKKWKSHHSANCLQISFSDEDHRDVQTPHEDPLVIKLRIGDSDVKRVLIGLGSCSEIMYPDLFHGLGLT